MAIVGKENEFELLKQELYGLAYFVDPVFKPPMVVGGFFFLFASLPSALEELQIASHQGLIT